METEISDLGREIYSITNCPVLVERTAPATGDFEDCGSPLVPVVTQTIRGDDYGEWTEWDVSFPCGHTFAEMVSSLRNREYV